MQNEFTQTNPANEERPWGMFSIIGMTTLGDAPSAPSLGGMDGKDSQIVVKKIIVKPGMRISYQSHKGRAEHWYIVKGQAKVVIDGKESNLTVGDSCDCGVAIKHRIGNSGTDDLVFIEISTGHVDEADITRYEDDFGRASIA